MRARGASVSAHQGETAEATERTPLSCACGPTSSVLSSCTLTRPSGRTTFTEPFKPICEVIRDVCRKVGDSGRRRDPIEYHEAFAKEAKAVAEAGGDQE